MKRLYIIRKCALLAMGVLLALAPATASAVAAAASQPTIRNINVDCAATVGPLSQVYNFSVGSDRAIIHLRPTDQRDLKYVHDQIGFRYIRFHGLLNEEMKTYSEAPDGSAIYHWDKVDGVYDFLLSIGMKPFVELGFIPEKLASGHQHIFYWRGNTTPPRDQAQWGRFITALVQHLTQRYGSAEVRQWYFEVWNEPNLDGFWHGTQADYFKLYATTALAVKSVDPAYRVGGPATAGCQWIGEFLKFCSAANVAVDFVSTHTYGVSQGFLDANGNGQTVLDDHPSALAGSLPPVVKSIRSSPLPTLPLFITEWSTSYSSRDPVHDSYVSAAYILQTLRNVPAGVEGMSYWTFSDQFEESGPPPKPFHGGFGLLNAQGLRKPAFFAYRFLNQLGPNEVHCDDPKAWACAASAGSDGGAGTISVLFWDFTHLKQDAPNPSFYTRDLPAAPAGNAHLALAHLRAGDYALQVYRVGYRRNDVYDAYLDLGSPKGAPSTPALLPEAIANHLRQHCSGEPEFTRTVHVDSNAQPWTLDLPLNQNDVYLVQLGR